MEISSTFWSPDITDWWRHQEETHPKYADLSNVALDMFSIIPHGVGVEAGMSLGRVIIGRRQSKSSGGMLWEKVVVRQFPGGNKASWAGDCPACGNMETENDLEL